MLLLLSAIAWTAPTVTPATVPATGHQEVEVEVERFGRYALEVSSPRGTAVQLVDKMTGPGPSSGRRGEQDGRLDVFLEPGRTKLWLESASDGTGETTVRASRFEELQGPDLPLLIELREEVGTLGDREQRSWWIDVPERRQVEIEAAARHLGDLRLWQDGTWLHPTMPSCAAFEPEAGMPWTRCQVSVQLEPGLYRVTAYGAPSAPWTEDSDEQPFWLRYGLPVLGTPSEQRITLDDKGYARFRVPSGTARHARLALPENLANAAVGFGGTTSGFARSHRWAEITDESRTPETTVSMGGAGEIMVRGKPGQVGTLQVLPATSWRRTLKSGRHVLTSIVGAHEADVLDPTGVVARQRSDGTWVIAEDYALQLESGKRYERQFNLLSSAAMLVRLPSDGEWSFELEGEAEVIVEPLMITKPRNYRSPEFKGGSYVEDFSTGLHVVSLRPTTPGIVTLKIAPNTWGRSARSLIGGDLPLMKTPRPTLQDLDFRGQNGDTLIVFGAPDTLTATDVRELPAPLEQPLSLLLHPGETVELRATVPERGVITATGADGEPAMVQIEGTGWQEVAEVRPGAEFTVEVTNPGKTRARVSLAWTPHTHLPSTAPPPLTPAQLATLPDFDDIRAGAPVYLDMERTERRTFDLVVDEPGLYAVQSTGLLATRGDMRTRTRTSFAAGNQNGVGRNFLVGRYLGSGQYQLTVTAQGRSMGHLGVELARARQVDGGPLLDGEPARITLPAGDAVAYGLDVPADGNYRIESVGLGRTFTCRIEDADGYPITAPAEQTCSQRLFLRDGHYSVVVAPERTESRRLTRAVRDADVLTRDGHGPHALRLDTRETHTWTEPADKSAPRPPDEWTFTLPADASVTVHLDDAMTGTLHGASGELGRLLPGQPFEQLLPAGDYRLELRSARRDHGLTYGVRVATWELLSGMERQVVAPGEIPVGVGGDGALTLASFGTTDVRATLRGPDGEVIAKSDDRPDDWNFRIESRVAPGTYTLEIAPVAGGSASTRVRMVQPEEVVEPALTNGEAVTVVPGVAVHTFPVPRKPGHVVLAHATSTESLGVSVEIATDTGWRTLGTATGRDVALPAWPGAGDIRVRLWSLDPRGAEATLTVTTSRAQKVGERALASGVKAGGKAPLSALRLAADAGVFALDRREQLWQCRADGGCSEVLDAQVSAGAEGLLLFARGALSAHRIAVDTGTPQLVQIPGTGDRAVDVTMHRGPVAVIARARAGVPVLRLHNQATDEDPEFGVVALAPQASLAVATGGAPYAQLRSADGQPLEARVAAVHFADPEVDKLDASGLFDAHLDPVTARRLKLGKGPHEIRLTLDAGVAVALIDDRKIDRVLWADADPRAFAVITDADEAWVLNVGGAVASARVRRSDAALADRVVDAEATSWSSPDAATRVLTVSPGGEIAIAGGDGVLLTSEGRLVPLVGRVSAEGGGTAWIDARPGVGAVHKPLASASGGKKGKAVDAGTVTLDGPEAHLSLQGEGLVELGIGEPVAVTVHGDEPETVLLPEGGWVRRLSTGEVEVSIRALGGRTLSSTAELRVTAPTPIGEGIGPEVLIGPGEARAFTFEVPRDGPIGLGVRATADRVEATLFANGTALGTGLVQMTEVEAGPHVLVLHLPSDAAPLRARPVLTGIEPPDTGPPEEVVRHYLELASEAP